MFVGSGFAYALAYMIPSSTPQQQLYFNEPLEDSDEAPFLQQNFVIVRLFYTEEQEESTQAIETINELFQDLGGKIVVEFIDVDLYDDYSDRFDFTETPFVYLKGNSIDKIYDIEYFDLQERICDLYFEEISECELIQ